MIALRSFLDINGGNKIKIIAKIENQEGVKNFKSILNRTDGIMVARGDMGVEIPYELLPGIQKRFIRECYQSGKIVITATQLLESMIESRRPTRAEITDVANAVFDGTSAVMLSGETASGKYPVEAVRAMAKIAEQAEEDAFDINVYSNLGHSHDISDITNAISAAACTTAEQMNAKAIIADTTTGTAARRVSKYRPTQIIIAATPLEKTYHQLSMSWGVYPILIPKEIDDVNVLFSTAIECAKEKGLISSGDSVVLTAGVPLKVRGNTNMLKVQIVK
jgi:pyruvate kinase